MAGVFDFLHLKRNTRGSSNELSFDVLDAARNDLDSKRRRGSHGVIATPMTIKPIASDNGSSKQASQTTGALLGVEARHEDEPAAKPEKKTQKRESRPKKERAQTKRASKPKKEKKKTRPLGEPDSKPKVKKKAKKQDKPINLLETSTDQTVKPSRGTSHGVKKNSALSVVPEVERRKRKRLDRKKRIAALVAVLAVAVIGVGLFFGYRYYQGRVAFEERYANLVDNIAKTDEHLVKMDEIVAKGAAFVTDDDISTLEMLVPQARECLKDIPNQLDAMSGDAAREKDGFALEYAKSAVEGREDMVDSVEKASALYAKSNNAARSALEAWEAVVKADELARESIEEANAASNNEAFEASKNKTEEAIGQLEDARVKLADVATVNEGAEFSAQDTYLAKRVEALQHAIAVNDALIQGDRQKAIDENDAYNKADEEAVRLASKLPSTPSDQARKAYEKDLSAAVDQYRKARDRITQSDSDVRAYLASRTP